MSVAKTILSCCCLLVGANLASGKEWRGIVPLHSTRLDVERLLGSAKNSKPTDFSDYETEDEDVTVMYASGPPCGNNGFRMWKVPRDTVIGITVYPKRELPFADLHLDESQYKKTDNQGHGPVYFYYTDEREGIQYEVTQGRVMGIIYSATAKDKNDLRCSLLNDPSENQKAWRGIVPLHSTRADVERILGRPNGKYGRYELENEWATVSYSTGRCVNGWDVPEGTVIHIAVSPTRPLRIYDLRIDLGKYDRFRDPHTSLVYYNHRSGGIRYVVSEPEGETNGKVLTTYYESTIEDQKLFYCHKSDDNSIAVPRSVQAWRQIQPLRTSRKQVERLLGRSKVIGTANTYDFTNETVSIFYQKYSCRINSQGWNVPINTVTSVRIEPKKKVRLSETQWDLSKFRKEQGSYDDLYSSYLLFRNEESGITLSVMGDVLEAYIYGPKRSDTAKRCPNYSVAEEQRLRDCDPIVFLVECSSEEISVGQSVSCRAWFDSTPLDFSPTIDWSVSKNASFVRGPKGIKVSARNSKAQTILVVGEVKSPNICMRSSSITVHVRTKSRNKKQAKIIH